jgi:hypothetical protein
VPPNGRPSISSPRLSGEIDAGWAGDTPKMLLVSVSPTCITAT